MAASELAPPPAATGPAASNPGKRKKPPRGKGRGNAGKGKKARGAGELAARRRHKPSTKFLKLLEKRARDYNSDDDDEAGGKRPRPRPRPPVQKHGDGADAAAVDSDDDEGLSEEEEASSSGDESGGAVVTRFENGCRAFRIAFSKIIAKKLPDNPLGPILSAHKKLVAAKLAEEAEEHKSKGVARKEKLEAAEKGHIIPANIMIDNKEKMLMKVATQGVVRLFNEVSKRQNPRKGLNTSRASAKGRTQTVPSNQGQKGQASSNLSKHTGQDQDVNESGWAPLRDSYMLGSKLKDWDKMQDSDAAKQPEVHFDNFSDEE